MEIPSLVKSREYLITLNSDYDRTTSRVRRSISPNYLKSVFDYFGSVENLKAIKNREC